MRVRRARFTNGYPSFGELERSTCRMGRIFSFAVAVVLLGGAMAPALAEGDPPGRAARLNYSEGTVAYAAAGDNEWTDANLNRPLVPGDKLWTDKGVRAEIQVGSSLVRMDGRTQLTVLALDDRSAQLSVTQGTVYLRVRNLPEGENFELDTPQLAWRAAYPGDYRLDVDARRGVTRVTVHSGTGAVYGEQGQALPMGGGQQITFSGRLLEKVNVQEQPPQDNFDRWAAERNRRDDQSVAARYVPREAVGYQLLDASGEWRQDANYGPVWFPQGLPADWAPYRRGRWEWITPWGWTWIDEAPWAFVTSHYGRWALIGARWAWAPGKPGLRPIYAPALVAFVGGDAPLSAPGKTRVTWFPLAPGEAWQPPYRATPLYISSVNANMPPLKQGGYAYERRPQALTTATLDDSQRGKPSGGGQRATANTLPDVQAVAAEQQQHQPAAEPRHAPEQARREAVAVRRAEPVKREREARAKHAPQVRRLAAAKKDEQVRRAVHAQQVARARRAAERDARQLAQQRAQREAWQKQQQALAEQFRRDQRAWEEQQRAGH